MSLGGRINDVVFSVVFPYIAYKGVIYNWTINMKHLSSSLLLLLFAACETPTVQGPAYQSIIQAGINAAVDGDTVLVQPGTYVENINFYGKSIVVASLFLTTGDTAYISQTVIDGNSNGSVVMFENQEDTAAVLIGFTITNGYAGGGDDWLENCGGGIYCGLRSTPRLEHLRVIGNESENMGGGIFCYSNASPSLVNVTVSQNIAYIGGGIYFEYESSPSLMNVTVSGNMADYAGGIYCYSKSSPSLANVIISGNTATTNGGGIQFYDSSPSLVNVTVSGNTAYNGGGIFCVGEASPSLVNTILWNNAPQEIFLSELWPGQSSIRIAYSDVQGGKSGIVTNGNTVYWLEGNIAADPSFLDAESGDFHLQWDSPCIDAGTAFFTWENDTLANLGPDDYTGSAPDMCAFEHGTVSMAGSTVPAHR